MKLTALYTSLKEELMSKKQREKLTARTTPEKPRPQQPFVQIEGKLTQEQLEAIAGGGIILSASKI